MKYDKILIVVSLLLIISGDLLAISPRTSTELDRYTLLRDKVLIERYLQRDVGHEFFFDIKLHKTSGLLALINEVDDVSNSKTSDPVKKQLDMNSLFVRNLNTGHFVDIDLGLGIPLPQFRFLKNDIYPGVKANANAGASLSTFVPVSSIIPSLEAYLKLEYKYGMYSFIQHNRRFMSSVYLYQMTRSDSLMTSSSTDVAAGDGEVAGTDDLGNQSVTYNLDYSLKYSDGKSSAEIMLSEFKLRDQTPAVKVKYGHTPLVRGVYRRKFEAGDLFWEILAGSQYRNRYTFSDGLFFGTKLSSSNGIFSGLVLLENKFLTLSPKLKWKFIKLVYGLKIPVNNGRSDVWMPNIHYFNVKIFF